MEGGARFRRGKANERKRKGSTSVFRENTVTKTPQTNNNSRLLFCGKFIRVLGGSFWTTKPLSRENCMSPGRIQMEGFCSVHFLLRGGETRVCANKKSFFQGLFFSAASIHRCGSRPPFLFPLTLSSRIRREKGEGSLLLDAEKRGRRKIQLVFKQIITYGFIANFQ